MGHVIVYFVFSAALYFLLRWLLGDRDRNYYSGKNLRIFQFVAVLFLILFVVSPIARWGSKVPGSFWERSTYEGYVYVYLYPNGQTTKSYRVPARFERGYNHYDDYLCYHLIYVVMPNGGAISFEHDDCLKLNKIVKVFNYNDDRDWGVQLTSDKVN